MIGKPVNAVAELLVEPAGMLTVTAEPGAPKSAASPFSPAANDNVTVVADVNVELVAPVNEAVTVAAPALPADSTTDDPPTDNPTRSRILKSAGTTANPEAEPVNRIVSPPSTTVSVKGVTVTSTVPDVSPDKTVTSTVADSPRS